MNHGVFPCRRSISRVSRKKNGSLVVTRLQGTSQKVCHAQILLKADADGPALTHRQIAEAFSC
jgi:hypothetical protein